MDEQCDVRRKGNESFHDGKRARMCAGQVSSAVEAVWCEEEGELEAERGGEELKTEREGGIREWRESK